MIVCSCSGLSSSCDGTSGICSGCSGNTTGDYCNQCLPGFTNFMTGIGCTCKHFIFPSLHFFHDKIKTKKTNKKTNSMWM